MYSAGDIESRITIPISALAIEFAGSKDKTSEEIIDNKKDALSNSGRVTGIGEYKFTPPGGKQKKDDFHKFNTGVRSDSTLTGQTGSILDRYK